MALVFTNTVAEIIVWYGLVSCNCCHRWYNSS